MRESERKKIERERESGWERVTEIVTERSEWVREK